MTAPTLPMRSPPAPPSPVERTPATGGRVIFLAQGLRLIVRLGSAALLARLLSPTAYGLFGMAAAVFGLLYMARDFGIVTALQQADLTPQRFNAYCRIGLLGGLGLCGLGLALAVPTGWFFAETATVPWLLAAMGSAFIFSGLAAPALGVLYREQQAGRVALIEAAGMALGSGAAVAAAWGGAGVWALVLMGIVTDAAVCVLAWRACPWRPTADTSGTAWFSLAALGANLTAPNFANYVTRTLDQVTVGRMDGAVALGLYGRGAQIAALPAQYGLGPFTPTMVATLGRCRANPAEFTAFFRRGLNSLLHVSFAAAAVCIAVPELVVRGLFGPQWLAAVPVVRWLGIALAFQPWLSAPLWLLGGQGEGRRLLLWSLGGVALMGIGCALAARAGMEAIAMAAAATAVLHAALGPAVCARRTAVRVRDWLQPALLPALLHGGMGAVWCATARLLPGEPPAPLRAAALLAVALAYYGALHRFSPRVRAEWRAHLFWSR